MHPSQNWITTEPCPVQCSDTAQSACSLSAGGIPPPGSIVFSLRGNLGEAFPNMWLALNSRGSQHEPYPPNVCVTSRGSPAEGKRTREICQCQCAREWRCKSDITVTSVKPSWTSCWPVESSSPEPTLHGIVYTRASHLKAKALSIIKMFRNNSCKQYCCYKEFQEL